MLFQTVSYLFTQAQLLKTNKRRGNDSGFDDTIRGSLQGVDLLYESHKCIYT